MANETQAAPVVEGAGTDHGGEQQSHEDGPCDQEEDDEDADDFVQRSLQPHHDLGEGEEVTSATLRSDRRRHHTRRNLRPSGPRLE